MEIKSTPFAHFFRGLKQKTLKLLAKTRYQLVKMYECPLSGNMMALMPLIDGSLIEKRLSELLGDKRFIASCDKKTIFQLAHLNALEKVKPDYVVLAQHMDGQGEECKLEIQSRSQQQIFIKPLSACKDQNLIAKLSPQDANRIGYLTGMQETLKEMQLKEPKQCEG